MTTVAAFPDCNSTDWHSISLKVTQGSPNGRPLRVQMSKPGLDQSLALFAMTVPKVFNVFQAQSPHILHRVHTKTLQAYLQE